MTEGFLSVRQHLALQEMGVDVWVRRPHEPATRVTRDSRVPHAEGNSGSANSADALLALNKQILTCTACELHKTRTQAVCGVGTLSADVLVIGEAPGADEDKQGEPFVGRAGQLLNEMLRAVGRSREQVFIANILKCRPPQNRDPRPGEVEQCLPFLRAQIELLRPRLIVVVGRIAAHNLLGVETPLGQLRGRVHYFGANRIPVVVTYHPAYLLRSPAQKSKSWQDLLLVMDVLSAADGKDGRDPKVHERQA